MARNWDTWLETASGPASATEEEERDRTLARIRKAIEASLDIPSSVLVYVKGSYANNTNVRRDSDVDVAIEWTEQFKVHRLSKAAGMTPDQLGYVPAPKIIESAVFRARVEKAMIGAFGAAAVDVSGDKAIHVVRGSDSLDADVVPCFALRRYHGPTDYREGHRIYRKNTQYASYVDNFPKQHKRNGIAKNNATSRRYKEIVRCLKRLEGELFSDGLLAQEYPGYLVECLLYNVPNDNYGNTRRFDDLDQSLVWLWNALVDSQQTDDLVEVSGLQWLFRNRSDRSPSNARDFVSIAWHRLHDKL